MNFDYSKMNELYSQLNKNINNYEDTMLNNYYEFNDVSNYWDSQSSKDYQNEINAIKNNNIKVLNQLKAISNIYSYILKSYKSIGDKVYININSKEQIDTKFDLFIDKLNNLIQLYDSLIQASDSNYINYLISERDKIIIIKSNIHDIHYSIKNIFGKVSRINNNVNKKVNQIEYLNIKEGVI